MRRRRVDSPRLQSSRRESERIPRAGEARARTSAEHDAINLDRLALVLELHRRAFLEPRRVLEHAPEVVREENLALGGGAEARRGIHGVADHGELEPALGADVPGEGLAE